MAIIKQQTSVGEDVEKWTPIARLVGLQTGETTMENSMELTQKLTMELPFDPAIPLLGLYPKNPETPIHKSL